MRKLESMDLITLNDGKKYVVSSKVSFENKDYLFIIEDNNNLNFKFVEEFMVDDKIHLKIVTNQNLIVKLLPLVVKNIKETYANVN